MPNTLAHIGINGLVTRTLIRKADLLWIYLGALIPDFPWILQRVVLKLNPAIDSYDLRLYCIVMSSLLFSLIVCVALANLSEKFKRTFTILALGSLIHLVLDSIEKKWANGVQLFVPFDWNLLNIGLFWPEDLPIYIITFFGLFYVLYNFKETISTSIKFVHITPRKILISFVFITIYFSVPLLLLNSAEEANNHYVNTLRDREYRMGNYFEVDRGFYSDSPKGDEFITPFNEKLKVKNLDLKTSETMSIRAKFISKDEIQIIDYHIHSNRDIFSYAGLLIIIILFTISLVNKYRFKKQSL